MNIILVTGTSLVDIVGPGFDAGIRIAEIVPQDIIAIPIGSAQRKVVVGSPAYFHGRPKPLVPGNLLRHQCIRARMAGGVIDHWAFERRGENIQIDVPGQLTLDETTLITGAAQVGALHPRAIPAILTEPDELEAGMPAFWTEAARLQRPLPDGALRILARGSKQDGAPDEVPSWQTPQGQLI